MSLTASKIHPRHYGKVFAFLHRSNSTGMTNRIYQSLLLQKAKGHKSFAVLIDPDKVTVEKDH